MLNFMTCAIFSLPFRIHLRDLLSGSAAADPNRYGDHFICVVLSWINDLLQSIQKLLITCVVLKFHSGGFFHFYHKIVRIFWYFVYIHQQLTKYKQTKYSLFWSVLSLLSYAVLSSAIQFIANVTTHGTIYLRDQSTFRPLVTWLINWE